MPRAINSLSRNKFAKRRYEAIALVIQHLVLSDDEHSDEEASGARSTAAGNSYGVR